MKQMNLLEFVEEKPSFDSNMKADIINMVKSQYGEYIQDIGRSDCNIVASGGNLYMALWRNNAHAEDWGNPYRNQEEHVTICGEMSYRIFNDIEQTFENHGAVKIEGKYIGEGAKYSPDKSGGHVWIRLADGTIIDGAFKQYQDPSLKRRKRLRILEPNDPAQKEYVEL